MGGGHISAVLGELKGGIAGEDIEEKSQRLEQELQASAEQVESLSIQKTNIRQELDEEQHRNDDLSQRLLQLEEQLEQQNQAAVEGQDESENTTGEVFDLEQEIKTLKAQLEMEQEHHRRALEEKNEVIAKLEMEVNNAEEHQADAVANGGDAKTQGLLLRANDKIQKQEAEIKELKVQMEEIGSSDALTAKKKEIKTLIDQNKSLDKEIGQLKAEHEKTLKQKEETIAFFQGQVVEMQKKMPKPQASKSSKGATAREDVGEEGTMTLGGEKDEDNNFGEGSGFFGLLRQSPGWLGGRKTVDEEKSTEVPDIPAL
jgi:predicted  nucleic acid-binding Zn-ribbon protein